MSGETMREERRVVTALFADVAGSTELTERLDPEDARDLIGTAVARMVGAVERFGGTVKDLAGDGVLALFGAPVAHEDDPERAVRAGLAMVEAVDTVAIRVGIETGLVILGPVGAGTRVEYGATGDTINVAARLQSHAPPGGVLVGAVTQRAARSLFDWGEERRFELKGKAEPVAAFEALRARDGGDRGRDEGVSTPMIGRDDERARALERATRALAGEGGVLVIVGEPGIGKSRLVDEVRRSVTSAGGVRWLEGRCASFGQTTPYLPLREILLGALELSEDQPNLAEAAAARLPALLGREGVDLVPYLEAVIGTREPTGRSPETVQLRTVESLRLLVAGLAERGPIVVAIEDLHWADPSTLHALEHLVPAAAQRPVLFVLTRRAGAGGSDRLERLASTPTAERSDTIELHELGAEDDALLLDSLVGHDVLPDELRRRVTETCGGNPFFLGELVRSWIDAGVLRRGGDAWSIVGAGAGIELPATIEKVILARMDVLEPVSRDVLTAGSVLGRQFSLAVLERVLEADPRPVVGELRRLDLLEPEESSDELAFRHALIQEVAYGSLLKKRRRELHARAAAAIGELWPDRLDEQLGVLAYHHRGAGEIDAARACHVRAAERAERLHAVEEAIEHLSSAIALAEELGRTEGEREVAELRLARARVRARTGDVSGAIDDLERVLAAEPPPDVAMRAHDDLGFVLAGAADYRAAIPHLTRALDDAVALGDRAAQVSALSRLSLVHTNRLDFVSGLEYGGRAMALAESMGDERSIATAMDGLKQVALQIGDFDRLEELAGRLAEIHRRTDDLWLLQFVVLELGYADALRGRAAEGIARIEESREINRRIGDRGNEPVHLGLLGRACRGVGDYGRALELGRRALGLARSLEHQEWIALLGVELAGTLLEVAALEEASAVLDAGAAAGERAGADMHLVRCLGLHALAADRLGDERRAAQLADRAAAVLAEVRIGPPRAYVMGRDAITALASVRLGQGRLEDAASLARAIVAACEASGVSDGVVDGRLVLAELERRRGGLEGATAEAELALAEAQRTGLPTAWLAHAAIADTCRVTGDVAGAADHLGRAEALVAALAETIDDAEVRAGFEEAASERLSARGRPG